MAKQVWMCCTPAIITLLMDAVRSETVPESDIRTGPGVDSAGLGEQLAAHADGLSERRHGMLGRGRDQGVVDGAAGQCQRGRRSRAYSLSTMVPTAWPSPMDAFTGGDRSKWKISGPSTSRSPFVATVTFLLVWPGVNVRTPDLAL